MMSDIHPTGSSPEDGSSLLSRLPTSSDVLRRSSSRSIKRKKFDDELVDTSNPFKRIPSSRRSSESSQPDQKPPSVIKKVHFKFTIYSHHIYRIFIPLFLNPLELKYSAVSFDIDIHATFSH